MRSMQRQGGITFLALVGLCFGAPTQATASEDVGGQVYVDNVVIVLDASGSMNGRMGSTSKMNAARTSLKVVLKSLPASTHVGLLVFGASNLSNDWVYPLGPRDDATLVAAVDEPVAAGGTPLGEYIKRGADRLLEERSKQFGYGSYRLLVVTDGEAGDPNLVDQYAPDIMGRGIVVDVIGVGMKGDHTLAKRVHSYRRADDSESLKRAVAEVFAEVSDTGDAGGAVSEAFAVIDPLPIEVAGAMINALGSSGNHPIGEKPPEPPPESSDTGSGGSNSAGSTSATGSSGSGSSTTTSTTGSGGTSTEADDGLPIEGIIGLGAFLVFMIFGKRKKKS